MASEAHISPNRLSSLTCHRIMILLCKTKPISATTKRMQPPFPQRIMKMKSLSGSARTNPIKANFTSTQRRRKAVRCQTSAIDFLSSVHEGDEKYRSPRLIIDPMLPIYKPGNDQYYVRRKCRCGSMVEHSFRKAGVEGSNPPIGCRQSLIDIRLLYGCCLWVSQIATLELWTNHEKPKPLVNLASSAPIAALNWSQTQSFVESVVHNNQ